MLVRTLSFIALWGLVIGVVTAFGKPGGMWILAVMAVVTQFEIYVLFGSMGLAANRLSGLATGALLIPLAYYIEEAGSDILAIGALMMAAAAVFHPAARRGLYVKRLLPTFFGLLYAPFLLHYFVKILQAYDGLTSGNGMDFGLFFILWVVAVAKFSDVGALLVGKLFGRTKMAPSISPAKTIEGLVGGFAASAGVGAGLPWLFQVYYPDAVSFTGVTFPPSTAALLALPVAAAAVIGDLIASVLKRLAEVKDSGGSIPGIGGMLDLTDSLVLAAPTGYFLLLALLP